MNFTADHRVIETNHRTCVLGVALSDASNGAQVTDGLIVNARSATRGPAIPSVVTPRVMNGTLQRASGAIHTMSQ